MEKLVLNGYVLDAIAGFLGSLSAIASQETRLSRASALSAVWLGTLAAAYGAPVLAEWQNLTKSSEYLCAFLVGLTAHTHIVPSIMSSAAVLSRLPAKWLNSRFKDL